MPDLSGTSLGQNLSLQALQKADLLQDTLYSGPTSVHASTDQGVPSDTLWEKHLLPKVGT